jgi:PAS domain S-box-containing protein
MEEFVPDPRHAENRKERRYLVDQPARITLGRSSTVIWDAHICDISTRGMKLITDDHIDAEEIRIRWNGRDIQAAIRYQNKLEDHYQLGVEFFTPAEQLMTAILVTQSNELRHVKTYVEHQRAALDACLGLLDFSPDALIVTSFDGLILFWNHGAEQVYGWTRQEAVNQSLQDLLDETIPSSLLQPNCPLSAIQLGKRLHFHRSGSAVMVRSSVTAQRETDGTPRAIFWVNQQMAAE